jgi:hypothetical protein
MAQDFRNQVDLIHPASLPNIEVHVPNGQSASTGTSSLADNPSVSNAVGTPSKTLHVNIVGTQGSVIRFSSPA